MTRKAVDAVWGEERAQGASHGLARAVGWYAFLAFIALTPLVMGSLPPQLGALSLFRAQDPVSLPKAVTIIFMTGLSLASLCVSVVRGESQLRWHPVLWIVLGIFGWAAVSTLLAPSPARSVLGSYSANDGLVAIFAYGLVVLLAVQYVRSTRALRIVSMVAVVSGSLVAAYALLQYWGIDVVAYPGGLDRVISTFGNPDMLGDYLVFPFALAVGLGLSKAARWTRVGWWAGAALIASAILVSGTRGAWLGAAVVALCVGLASWRVLRDASRPQKALLGGLVVFVTVAIALVFAYTRPLAGRSLSLSSGLAKLSNGRDIIWLTGLHGWLTRPLTGWGPDGFGRAFDSAVGANWYALVGGLQKADNAHNFLVQALVTLGIPGLVLTVWALLQTAIQSWRVVRSASGHSRALLVGLWAGLVGLIVALFFGVTFPAVSVWLWLAVGLLLAPISHRAEFVPPKVLLAGGAVLGVGSALLAGSWLVADISAGWAMQQPPGPAQVAALETATAINPISPDYRWLVAEALAHQAVAEQSAGATAQIVDQRLTEALAAFSAAAAADPGDAMVRVAYANVLLKYAAANPGGTEVSRAVDAMLEARSLAPNNPAVLVMLARAYQTAGRNAEAEATAEHALVIAPDYAAPLLGTLGQSGTSTP